MADTLVVEENQQEVEEVLADQTENPQETPAETPEQEDQEESAVTAEPETEENTEVPEAEAEPISRRKAKRLEKLESLVEQLRGTQPVAPQVKGMDYRQEIDADENVYQNLETKSQEYGQAQYNAGLEEAKSLRFHTRLEIDAPRVESKFPVLDKSSEEFNPAIAQSINNWYLSNVGYDARTDSVKNPNLRYADFVEGVMELVDNLATTKTVASGKNIARQAATTGLRPDGSSARSLDLNKQPQDMTDEELSAVIKQGLPRDSRGRYTSQQT